MILIAACLSTTTYADPLEVEQQTTSVLDIGLGWNSSACTDGRRWPEMLALDGGKSGKLLEFGEEGWDKFFGLVEWSGCYWMRHAMEIRAWEPKNDNDDPNKTDWSAFTFDSSWMKRNYLILDHAEKLA